MFERILAQLGEGQQDPVVSCLFGFEYIEQLPHMAQQRARGRKTTQDV